MGENHLKDSGFVPFRPHPLVRGGHAQTIAAAYLVPPCRRVGSGVMRRHEVLLGDGDRLVMHDDRPAQWTAGNRVALLAHGLGGSHRSVYMVRVAGKLNEFGIRTFRMDLRGFGAGLHTARRATNAGRSDDLMACVQRLMHLCPGSPLTLIGFSMSGNIVLKLLGEVGRLAPGCMESAVAVCPPVDLVHCAHHLRRGLNRIYDWSFVRNLHAHLQRRRRLVPGIIDRVLRPLPQRLLEFDDRYTAPLAGYRDAWHYYEQASAAPLLAHIGVRTLIVTSADDPVIPVQMFDRYALAPSVTLHVTRHGGHLGFLGVKGVDPDRHWLDWRIVEWIGRQTPRTCKPLGRTNQRDGRQTSIVAAG